MGKRREAPSFFLGFFLGKSGREAAGVFFGGNSGFLAEFGVKTVIFWGNLEIFEAREFFFGFFFGEIGEADFGVFFWGNRQNLKKNTAHSPVF